MSGHLKKYLRAAGQGKKYVKLYGITEELNLNQLLTGLIGLHLNKFGNVYQFKSWFRMNVIIYIKHCLQFLERDERDHYDDRAPVDISY